MEETVLTCLSFPSFHTCEQGIDAIYQNTVLDSVTSKGKTYYNNSTTWAEAHPLNENDVPCDGYLTDECTFTPVPAPGKIAYNIKTTEDTPSTYLDEVIFPADLEVVLHNKAGINHDHRGSNHTDIQLDFHDTWVLRGSTRRDLAEGLYRVKSHKFDLCYEMFSGIEKIVFTEKGLNIHLIFDHGS